MTAATRYTAQQIRGMEHLLLSCEEYFDWLLELEPLVPGPGGRLVCRFNCGFGTMRGIGDPAERDTHRTSRCLWPLAHRLHDTLADGRQNLTYDCERRTFEARHNARLVQLHQALHAIDGYETPGLLLAGSDGSAL